MVGDPRHLGQEVHASPPAIDDDVTGKIVSSLEGTDLDAGDVFDRVADPDEVHENLSEAVLKFAPGDSRRRPNV
ncbi:hypothetical protein, partial [Pinisolibacter sp.]|uniref:hypothetical protein n=1 Tax=Pinisolibacter sp. TaxID=2172024 RepID=UPI002FDEB564